MICQANPASGGANRPIGKLANGQTPPAAGQAG